jgi:hypothetical protein
VWPVSWSETPIFQQVYGRRVAPAHKPGSSRRTRRGAAVRGRGSPELLHDDYAYEFQIGWSLWELETTGPDPRWARQPRLVRVTGYGPLFDDGAYEQDGHVRIDFGSDAAIP